VVPTPPRLAFGMNYFEASRPHTESISDQKIGEFSKAQSDVAPARFLEAS
jgi:hypothetical protein